MSNYSMYRKELPPNPKKLPAHPIWRGIGCLLLVIVPTISFVTSSYLIDNRLKVKWLLIPEGILLPRFSDPFILVKILYALIFAFVVLAIVAFITFLINLLFGPKRYGPVDVPLESIKKSRKRK